MKEPYYELKPREHRAQWEEAPKTIEAALEAVEFQLSSVRGAMLAESDRACGLWLRQGARHAAAVVWAAQRLAAMMHREVQAREAGLNQPCPAESLPVVEPHGSLSDDGCEWGQYQRDWLAYGERLNMELSRLGLGEEAA